MAARRTRVTLSIPWDDEENDHPSGWGFGVLLDTSGEVHVVDFEEIDPLTGGLSASSDPSEAV